MCIENAMELTLKSDTFSALKEDFDGILARTVGNMQMKGAEDATITLKLSVSLENTSTVIKGENVDITRPSFKHDISSVMQVKDKKSGALTGDYQLVWDEDEGKYVMKRIDNGQISIDDVIEGDGEVIEAEYREVPELPAADEEDETKTPFGWLKQFVGQEMNITEAMGNYAVRTLDNKIVLTSATSEDNPFYCSAEILEAHMGHRLIARAGCNNDNEIVSITIECEDCGDVLFGIDKEIPEEGESVTDDETEEYPTDDELMDETDGDDTEEYDDSEETEGEDANGYGYEEPSDDDLADL